ncbi:MAG TPA: glycine--tRNA ligase [Opitutales bacterium]|nr:glycine--tRNA ligase [Opitutales bacterium]
MDALVALCKRRGFIFNSSEIYGGIGGFFDYGPLGVELKNNIKAAWWQDMVHGRDDMVGLDASIIMNPAVWKASGHVDGFADPMVDCKESKLRYRADQLFFSPVVVDGEVIGYISLLESGDMEEQAQKAAELMKRKAAKQGTLEAVKLRPYTEAKPEEYSQIPSPATGKPGSLTPPRSFNLMFSTHVGALEDASSVAYLRPETAQGIFANFKNVTDSTRVKIPFGIAQIGKAFRNEITPRNFIFRSREFEQMEIEYFINPDDETWPKLHREWIDTRLNWLASIGIPRALLQEKEHPKTDLAHYAKACTDILFKFPFGWQELEGIAARGNYDLTQHQTASGKGLEYFDEARSQRYLPHVIEPSIGVERCLLAVITAAYAEDEVDGEKRVFLKFHPRLAPIKAGIFPLVKNKPELVEKAEGLYKSLKRRWLVSLDTSGAIGKRYRRMDEAGTPYCFTIDYQTLEDDTVTVRERDSTQQSRIAITEVAAFLEKAIAGI